MESLISEHVIGLSVKDKYGHSVLHYAVIKGVPYTCTGGRLMDKLIMEYDLNPADKDNDGNTALHIAAMKGHVETDT